MAEAIKQKYRAKKLILMGHSWGTVIGLKAATTPLGWAVTIAAIALNFALLMRAIRFLPVGSVYAVFCGLGAAASVVAETLWFGEAVQPVKIALIGLLIVGVAGLKLVTPLAPAADVEARR